MIKLSLESFTVFASFVLYTITGISYYMKGNYPWALTWFSYARKYWPHLGRIKMKKEYENLLKHLDGILCLMKDEWREAGIKNKNKWQQKMDNALDERLRLMKLRDSNT